MYFDKPGKGNTDKSVEIAKVEAVKRGIKHIVVASTVGDTGLAAAKALKDTDIKLVVVTHSTGHGLGIKVHEAPSLRTTDEAPLAAGMVVTIEPGIYLADWGGVRIEDVAVIEADGARVLTGAPKHPRFG